MNAAVPTSPRTLAPAEALPVTMLTSGIVRKTSQTPAVMSTGTRSSGASGSSGHSPGPNGPGDRTSGASDDCPPGPAAAWADISPTPLSTTSCGAARGDQADRGEDGGPYHYV